MTNVSKKHKTPADAKPMLADSILPYPPLLYIGNSRWTSNGRNHAVHIAGNNRKPLCGKEYKNGALDVYESKWEYWVDEVTCQRCKAKYFR